jgi:hypothetical protein
MAAAGASYAFGRDLKNLFEPGTWALDRRCVGCRGFPGLRDHRR